mmetsp:Transcript_51375/g.122291  ORF Transcript_51375/g.122291 Transcript_51375/m.122291 type:complete len:323 (+) Transcript_51375:942-1910(+)
MEVGVRQLDGEVALPHLASARGRPHLASARRLPHLASAGRGRRGWARRGHEHPHLGRLARRQRGLGRHGGPARARTRGRPGPGLCSRDGGRGRRARLELCDGRARLVAVLAVLADAVVRAAQPGAEALAVLLLALGAPAPASAHGLDGPARRLHLHVVQLEVRALESLGVVEADEAHGHHAILLVTPVVVAVRAVAVRGAPCVDAEARAVLLQALCASAPAPLIRPSRLPARRSEGSGRVVCVNARPALTARRRLHLLDALDVAGSLAGVDFVDEALVGLPDPLLRHVGRGRRGGVHVFMARAVSSCSRVHRLHFWTQKYAC